MGDAEGGHRPINVGERFSSYEEFMERLNVHKKATLTKYWMRDSRTLEAEAKRCPDRITNANPALKYYSCKLACILGGTKWRSKKTTPAVGEKPSVTVSEGCQASINLLLSHDSQHLFVKSMNNDHNHSLELDTRKSFDCLRQKRKRSQGVHHRNRGMLKSRDNKKSVQKEILDETGQSSFLKDPNNASSTSDVKDQNSIDASIKILLEQHSCMVDVYMSNQHEFKGLLIQDKTMRDIYESFPEVLIFDVAPELINIGAPVFLFGVEDSVGSSNIVAVGILHSDDKESLDWLTSVFQKNNPVWPSTKTIITDKGQKERYVLQQHFPWARLLICRFHILNIFKQEIQCSMLGITPAEEILSHQYVRRILHSKNIEDYTETYNEMVAALPQKMMDYYNMNWHSIKEEWVLCFTHTFGNLLYSTNNRSESLNRTLKSIIPHFSSLMQFFELLFIELQVQRAEYDNVVLNELNKVVNHTKLKRSPPFSKYADLLTDYAFQYVEKQFKLKDTVNKDVTRDQDGLILINTSAGIIQVSDHECQCSFFVSMSLPCCHIFFVRRYFNMNDYDAELCLKRWTINYLSTTQGALRLNNNKSEDETEVVTESSVSLPRCKRALSAAQKHCQLMIKATRIAALGSEVSDAIFKRRCDVLDKIIRRWELSQECCVVELENLVPGEELLPAPATAFPSEEVLPWSAVLPEYIVPSLTVLPKDILPSVAILPEDTPTSAVSPEDSQTSAVLPGDVRTATAVGLPENLLPSVVDDDGSIQLQDKFSSFEEFMQRLSAHKKATLTEYWMRDCRTLKAEAKRCPHRVLGANPSLKYYYCKLSCIYGGEKWRSKKTTGARKNTFSFRQGCKAHMYLFLSKDRQHLFVKSMSNDHNHAIDSRESFCHLPQQRRLSREGQHRERDLLKIRGIKRPVQEVNGATGNVGLASTLSTLEDLPTAAVSDEDPQITRVMPGDLLTAAVLTENLLLMSVDLSEDVTQTSISEEHLLKMELVCSAEDNDNDGPRPIQLGDTFSSFEELMERLGTHKKATLTEYYMRDCRTFEAETKRCSDRVLGANLSLKYYYCKFSCIYGGEIRRSKATSARKNTFSFRQGCQAHMYLFLSEDRQHLFVKSMSNIHNHTMDSRESFGHLPQQRRLSREGRRRERNLLKIRGKKRPVQEDNDATGNFDPTSPISTTPLDD